MLVPLIKRKLVICACLLLVFAGTSFNCLSAQGQRELKRSRSLQDDAGRTVALASVIDKIVVPNNWILSMVLAIQDKEKVLGVSTAVTADSGLNALYPLWLRQVTVVGEVSRLNQESILELGTQVVLTQAGPNIAQMEAIDVPVIALDRMKSAEENVLLLGRILGREKQAQELADYYSAKVELAKSRTADIAEAARKKVYFVAGPGVTKTYGKDLGHGIYYRWAGGVLITEQLTGSNINSIDVSPEQILDWNPDVIVISYGMGLKPEDILADPRWSSLAAVKNHQVFTEPPPHFASLKKPISSCLGTLWLAKKLYPERFADIDIAKEAESFVKRFYGLDMKADFD